MLTTCRRTRVRSVMLFEVAELLEDLVDTQIAAVGLAAVTGQGLVGLFWLDPLSVYHCTGLLGL